MDLNKADEQLPDNLEKSSKKIELLLWISNNLVFQALGLDRFFLPDDFDNLVDYFGNRRNSINACIADSEANYYKKSCLD